MNKNTPPPVAACAAALAATGFAAGFFGPIALNPDANQGPLLGIFITGPVGALVGLALGVLLKWLPFSNERKWQTLVGFCIVGAITVLYFCLPEPKIRGYVIEGTIANCTAPQSRVEWAIKHWDDRIAAVTWAKQRAGWKQDIDRMLREEGVVVELQSARQRRLLEHRQPWNIGRLSVTSWQPTPDGKSYFARFAGGQCANYPQQPSQFYVAADQGSKEWPPTDLPNFLELAIVEPLPEKYRNTVQP